MKSASMRAKTGLPKGKPGYRKARSGRDPHQYAKGGKAARGGYRG